MSFVVERIVPEFVELIEVFSLFRPFSPTKDDPPRWAGVAPFSRVRDGHPCSQCFNLKPADGQESFQTFTVQPFGLTFQEGAGLFVKAIPSSDVSGVSDVSGGWSLSLVGWRSCWDMNIFINY